MGDLWRQTLSVASSVKVTRRMYDLVFTFSAPGAHTHTDTHTLTLTLALLCVRNSLLWVLACTTVRVYDHLRAHEGGDARRACDRCLGHVFHQAAHDAPRGRAGCRVSPA